MIRFNRGIEKELLGAVARPAIEAETKKVADRLPGAVYEQPGRDMGGDYGWTVDQAGDRIAGRIWTVSAEAMVGEAHHNYMVRSIGNG